MLPQKKYYPLFVLLFVFVAFSAQAQYSITGATSVAGGSVQLYRVMPAPSTTVTWSVVGGTLSNTTGVTTNVTWNCGATSGTVTATASGASIPSLSITINPNPALDGGYVNPASYSIANATSTTIICSAATGGSCNGGAYTYTWQSSANGTSWADIGSTNVQNYTTPALTTTTYYRRKVMRSPATTVFAYSTVATVTVNSPLVAGSINPSSQQINYNTAPPASLTLSGASGGNGTYTYQWQSSPDGTSWTNVGTGTTTYTIPVLIATTKYRVAVTSNGTTVFTAIVTVTVYPQLSVGGITPQAPVVSAGVSPGPLTCSTPTGGNGTYSYQWKVSTDNITFSNVTAADGSGGTTISFTPLGTSITKYYIVEVTSNGAKVNSGLCTISVTNAGVQPPATMAGSSDLSMNWTLSKSYDPSGNIIAESKQFFDDNGRMLQSQSKIKYRKDATTVYTHVFASQPVRDTYGRDALSTLAAPIDNGEFMYKSDFVRNPSGTAYGFANYDLYQNGGTVTDKTNNPDAVGSLTTKGTLGWYYSIYNTWEPYTATTAYPFSRQTFYSDGTGNAKKSAGVGETYKMGAGHENSSYITPVVSELNHYKNIRNNYFPASVSGAVPASLSGQAIQTIARDANGREAAVFTDKGGKTLMVANPGRGEAGNQLNITNVTTIEGTSLPNKNIFYFKLFATQTITITGGTNYTLYNMETELAVTATTLSAGYYKLVNKGLNTLTLTYSNAYADVSYSFYNQLGQLMATIAPEGVKKLYASSYATTYPTKTDVPFLTLYEYDAQGRLVATQSAEGGRTEFVYRKDGKIRFSRNAEQALPANNTYSYTNYDSYGRPVESGEYKPGTGGIAFNSDLTTASPMAGILENITSTGGLINGTEKDVTITLYDVTDASHGLTAYVQDPFYMAGAVSVTKKYSSVINNALLPASMTSATWYNYDEEGKLVWHIQYINGIGAGALAYKTTDYTYDPMGRLIERVYQKNTAAEYFAHKYDYDPSTTNLWKVSTRTSSGGALTLQAAYTYYLHGGVKRVDLATDLQGIDYTYTLQGALKAINNNDKTKDPGQDGISGVNAAVKPDAFGMVLDYYTGDYVNLRTGIQTIKGVNTASTIASDNFTGNIKAISWYSKKPVNNPVIPETPNAYVYQYDVRDQLIEANWANNLNFTNTPASLSVTTFNREKIKPFTGTAPGYDANGNILFLERTDGAGNLSEKFQYYYATNKNQLTSITNAAGGTPAPYASYSYDDIGQLTVENNTANPAQNKYIKYDVTGKVVMVSRNAAFTQPVVSYVYNELGQRIIKRNYNSSYVHIQNTYYVGDVIYTQPVGGVATAQEYEIDGGSGRIGVYYRQSPVYAYQLTDHLGNVRAVVAKNSTNLEVKLYNDFYPFGKVIAPATAGTLNYRYGYQGQYAEKDPETDWNAFELRMYDSKIARWLSVDPKGQYHSPYVGMGNNPVNRADPDGGWDWVLRADNTVYWDPKANSQATTKKGETWLGKDFVIDMDSYIDAGLWDGPNPWFDVSGSKLESFIQVIGNENSKGELIGVNTKFFSEIRENQGGYKGVVYGGFPNIERSINFYDKEGKFVGFNIVLEKHVRVPELERIGILMGFHSKFLNSYQDVNVAQRIDIVYVGKNLNLSFKTDIFPSATAKIIGSAGLIVDLVHYNQPSFENTHNFKYGLLPYRLIDR